MASATTTPLPTPGAQLQCKHACVHTAKKLRQAPTPPDDDIRIRSSRLSPPIGKVLSPRAVVVATQGTRTKAGRYLYRRRESCWSGGRGCSSPAPAMDPCPAASLLALAQMLSPPAGDEDEEGGGGSIDGVSSAGPGSIGPPKASATPATTQVKSGDSKEIWNPDEVPEGSEYDDAWDSREQPEYEILFKQHVVAEDMFLGMSRKDPSSACCEDMLIKIKLPDTKASDITLDIRETVLDLRSPQKFQLQISHFPGSSSCTCLTLWTPRTERPASCLKRALWKSP
ncbi:dynein axonemal assembly factor 6 isoform X2 [Rhineura floridana]|uniref:dynein axonemal assembly factor 6 isoform X2 n=1 Tax=Rhineura floridana TaxID=261503 RepID=UPI002AC7F777|nr:dynein axonemal assembly factor 6 isoform X2 [Rhineura floridana]